MMAVMLLVVIMASINLIISNSSVMDKSEDIANRQISLIHKAHEVKLAVVQVQQWLTDISATRGKDGLNDGFDEAEKNAGLFKTLIDEMQQLDPQQQQRYQDLLPVFDAYYRVGKKMARAYVEQGPEGGNKMMSEFDRVAASISEQVEGILMDVTTQVDNLVQEQNNTAVSGFYTLIISTLILIICMAAVLIIMLNSLSRLPKTVKFMNQIAEGDLNCDIKIVHYDEIGEINQAALKMRDSLKAMISQISRTIDDLIKTSKGVSQSTEKCFNNLHQQKSQNDELETSMNNMSDSIATISSNVMTSSDSTNDAVKEVSQSNKNLQSTRELIASLDNQISSATETVNQLHEDSNNIASIVDVIRGIAEQTNLLALNAAIEAARAGEQGRGFAVVADEVRTLASRTQESTEEINQMITRLHAGTENASTVMSQSCEQTTQVVEQFQSATDTLDNVAKVISGINQMSMQIAQSTKEQEKVSHGINDNISKINKKFISIHDNLETAVDASNELNKMSDDLQLLIHKFRY